MVKIASNIPQYQEVVRTPNVMRTRNPLRSTAAKIVSLDNRITQLNSSAAWNKLMQQFAQSKKKWNKDQRPTVAMVKLKHIMIDEDIQRALDVKHAVKIADIDLFDPRLMQVIFCVKLPGKLEFHSVDGQHTVTLLAAMIAQGLFQGEKDWQEVEVPVAYIETADRSFARNAFALINGRGKKKISNWYQHRTRVQSVRIDGSKLDENVEAEAKQSICEKYDCYPVDKDSDLAVLPGTFTHMEALKLDDAALELCCDWHNRYFHYFTIDGCVWFLIPQIATALKHARVKFSKDLQEEMAGIVQGVFGGPRQFHSAVKKAYPSWYRNHFDLPDEHTVEWDNHALGTAMVQLYMRLGGNITMPRPIAERFVGLSDWFDDDVTQLFVR